MCCCGGAVSALFCLWCQSGCRKGTVAGALTFFPPEPALYEFERIDKRGRVLAPDEDAVNYNDDDNSDSDEEKKTSSDNEEERAAPKGPLQVPETHGQTQKKMKSPVAQLTEQAAERRKRSKIRNARDTADARAGVTYKLLLDPRLQVPPHDDDLIQAVKIPSCCGIHVAAVVYQSPNQTPQTKTLIYSHGNATDIGAMFPLQIVLATSLQINVVVFDYSGYGESGGVPEEHRTYKDIDAVFEFVWQELAGCDSSRIVLYGQSVGSGPCCYLAEKLAKEKENLGGMILHSPFTSGMRVLTPSRLLACLDIYPNIDRIKKVKCPVMVIHGVLDQEVDVAHGQEMDRNVPEEFRREPWWVPNRGHNDVPEGKMPEYVRRLRFFLNSLDTTSN